MPTHAAGRRHPHSQLTRPGTRGGSAPGGRGLLRRAAWPRAVTCRRAWSSCRAEDRLSASIFVSSLHSSVSSNWSGLTSTSCNCPTFGEETCRGQCPRSLHSGASGSVLLYRPPTPRGARARCGRQHSLPGVRGEIKACRRPAVLGPPPHPHPDQVGKAPEVDPTASGTPPHLSVASSDGYGAWAFPPPGPVLGKA